MDAEKQRVLRELSDQLRAFEKTNFGILIPEIRSNFAYAISNAENLGDVAAVPGRITCYKVYGSDNLCLQYSQPCFGVSTHVGSVVLAAMKKDKKKRCALNIRYSPGIIEGLESLNYKTVFVDRTKEPRNVSDYEGSSVPWVLQQAIEDCGRVPDATYHKGAMCKEPITMLMGDNPAYVGEMVVRLLEKL